MTDSRLFPNSPIAVRDARRFVLESLANVGEEALEVIALMVSELATNCVRHAATSFVIRIEQSERAIRIEVADEADGIPAVQPVQLTEPHGRGLHIVQALANDWGVIPASVTSGKTVWFTIALPEPANGVLQDQH